ncbi:662_t:CDS:2 [Acaulospora morrowiae]|uniref:662_t:CDS:1 n=1 Tax=Acaulospora morrowiae TaxID=94023 RepID=A0A9N8VF40_9GLOM|nr:662_t:CDS:2 [Acaulospora morrowiae]
MSTESKTSEAEKSLDITITSEKVDQNCNSLEQKNAQKINPPTKFSFSLTKPPEVPKLDDNVTPVVSKQGANVPLINELNENGLVEPSITTTETGENKKKRKRSRWDQAGSTAKEAPGSTTNADTKVVAGELLTHLKSSSSVTVSNSARTVVPSQQIYTSDERQFVKYSDTYKPGMVRVGSKWVYPEDEITEGGTWEHKKRAEEMKKTAEQAALLTASAEAKRAHHIADFLPKEELEKFEQKVKAVKTGGTPPEYEDYASNKLDQSNIGFKMLMKQGWQAGTGLGKSGEGIAAPINKADSRPANAGLGQSKPEGVEEEDDEFEIYRKRMMLAYRFRPNPLNNPRRPYY